MAHYEAGTRVDDMVGAFNRGTKVEFKCTVHNLDWCSKDPSVSTWFPIMEEYFEDRRGGCVSKDCELVLISPYDTIDYKMDGGEFGW